jgi:DGQHR domain-containing protein
MSYILEIPAIRYRQGKGQYLYSFVIDGKAIPQFANIVRIGRDSEETNELFGYQRPEVYSHIKEIRKYLESDNPLMPNALVIAFDKKVKFRAFKNDVSTNTNCQVGEIQLPCTSDEKKKIGWIVDGQQRTAAIREAALKSFPIAVVGFQADEQKQREQFILVNSTKPLPKDLIYELLPSTETQLAQVLEKRKLPALLSNELNFPADFDIEHCPFAARIKTPTNPSGTISYNSVLKVLEHSLSDGILMRYVATNDGHPDIPGMVQILNNYWGAVSSIFAHAWSLPPSKSRLTHGAGMVAMGFLMDTIYERHDGDIHLKRETIQNELSRLANKCAWTEGSWSFGDQPRAWNDIQNLPKDIELLTNHIVSMYLKS